MGTQAYWFSYPWRSRVIDADGDPGNWSYAPTLADVKEDAGEEHTEVQKRTGRKPDYVYVAHSVLNAPEEA